MTVGTISIIGGIVLLLLLKIFVKDKEPLKPGKRLREVQHDELFKEDLDFDPSWSVLSSNTHHSDDE